MYPSKEKALEIIRDGMTCNPGPWGRHCLTAAHCAEAIAERCDGLDPEKAYAIGLLHDIGRKFGGRHLGHVIDGYSYMMKLGYDEVARICLTHSFNDHDLASYIGNNDVTSEEYAVIERELNKVEFDDYDRLSHLIDAISTAGGVVDIEERMGDVKRRYGSYPEDKWNINIDLMHYFEDKMHMNLYEAVDKDTYVPDGTVIGE